MSDSGYPAQVATAVAAARGGQPLDQIEAFLASAKLAAIDGITWQEFGELLTAFLRMAIGIYDAVAVMTGEEKKAAVMEAVGRLFDAVADQAVPTVAWPLWILARPAVRSLVLAIAAGAIEQILTLVRLA